MYINISNIYILNWIWSLEGYVHIYPLTPPRRDFYFNKKYLIII